MTVSLAESANYTADRKAVTVTVAPKEITVTADNQKKIAGEADPVLTYTADGLVGEDTLSGITVKRKLVKRWELIQSQFPRKQAPTRITGLHLRKVFSQSSRLTSPN